MVMFCFQILRSTQVIQTETMYEYTNMWVGPRTVFPILKIQYIIEPFLQNKTNVLCKNTVFDCQEDLIHVGARFSMCMREDTQLADILDEQLNATRHSACCVQNDGSGCLQTSRADCSVRTLHYTLYILS